MPYGPDLSIISLDEYRTLLKRSTLLPGRRMLLDRIDENFVALSAQKIETLAQLRGQLSAPKKLAALAGATGISEEYLILLKREMGSLEQKPVPLSSFPQIDARLIAELADSGIRNSRDYFERDCANSEELACLCDLVRINGVGAVAAKAFFEAGFRSVADVASASAAGMLQKVSAVNQQHNYYRAQLGEKDMQFCIDSANLLLKYSR
ncbi:MAG: DUF4332 domain-containing protein [Clostridiales bacterium]|nr:DUF4332 domain-containing protein [Clostridiales bacterium]